jgi:hypothetical protein
MNEFPLFKKEKVYITPTYCNSITSPPTYKTRYLTPSSLQNRSNNPLWWFCIAVLPRWRAEVDFDADVDD